MVERGRGGIVFMSSFAAEAGTATVALYSATKAFDLLLAEGLWYELRDSGVDVVAIRPGSTRTPSWESTQPPEGEIKGVMDRPTSSARRSPRSGTPRRSSPVPTTVPPRPCSAR